MHPLGNNQLPGTYQIFVLNSETCNPELFPQAALSLTFFPRSRIGRRAVFWLRM